MKVLAISSSPRKGGNSEVLCDEFLKGAAESGHEVRKIRLAEKKIALCVAWSNGNTERIAQKLQSAAGGDLLRIDPTVPYSGSYDEVVE